MIVNTIPYQAEFAQNRRHSEQTLNFTSLRE